MTNVKNEMRYILVTRLLEQASWIWSWCGLLR